jgi:hypothetical protein
MPKIFISYRRDDTIDATGRMFDRLAAAFGTENVFKDVDSIPLGSDFTTIIAERLNDCEIVIVVIGRFWLTVRGRDGKARLDNPGDYVRIEIEQALNSRAVVVPALIGNIDMPREEQLPESIRKLTRKHAISIRPDPDFHRDMDRLIRALEDLQKRRDSSAQKESTPPSNVQTKSFSEINPVVVEDPFTSVASKRAKKVKVLRPKKRRFGIKMFSSLTVQVATLFIILIFAILGVVLGLNVGKPKPTEPTGTTPKKTK